MDGETPKPMFSLPAPTGAPVYQNGVVENWPFAEREHGYSLHNPIHQLDFHFRNNHVAATRRGADWTWTWRLDGAGRSGLMKPVRPAAPHLAPCETTDCTMRLEYRRVNVIEWYVNSLQGIEQGFDVLKRPAGDGPLLLTATLGGLEPRLANGATTINFERNGTFVFSYSGLRVVDYYGTSLDAQFALAGNELQIIVDDSDARYPITIDPTSGACDEAWCYDADETTVDVCRWQADGNAGCSNVFNKDFEWEDCIWGKYCCPDGKYHADCDNPVDPATLCPDEWCDDGDFTTRDMCGSFEAPSTFECTREFDINALGKKCIWEAFCCSGVAGDDCANPPKPVADEPPPAEPPPSEPPPSEPPPSEPPPSEPAKECPDNWCNDGDEMTIDTCMIAGGVTTCSAEIDPELIGEECSYGTYCCNGIIEEKPCKVDPPPPPPEPCPEDNDWCEDGDISTLNTCTNYDKAQGTFSCTLGYDSAAAGKPCKDELFCCMGAIDEPCNYNDFGGACPDKWCDDGDSTTIDRCGSFDNGTFECTRTFNALESGKVCTWGLYCCNGAVAPTCASKDPPPSSPPPSSPPPSSPPPSSPPPSSPPPSDPPPSDGGAFPNKCLISFEGTSCPAHADVCNSTFTGGTGCVTDAPGSCSSGGAAYEISPADGQLMIQFGQDIKSLSAQFGHTTGAAGAMMVVGQNGKLLAILTSTDNCSGTVGKTSMTFNEPARSLILSAAGGPVYLDQLNLSAN